MSMSEVPYAFAYPSPYSHLPFALVDPSPFTVESVLERKIQNCHSIRRHAAAATSAAAANAAAVAAPAMADTHVACEWLSVAAGTFREVAAEHYSATLRRGGVTTV
jgi:hypothetical protein